MDCPNCGAAMVEQASQGVTVDFCRVCASVWFDTCELEDFLRNSSDQISLADLGDVVFEKTPGEQQVKCPRCLKWSLQYGAFGGVIAARCHQCQGLFFEKAVLERLVRKEDTPVPAEPGDIPFQAKILLADFLLNFLSMLIH